MKHPGDIDRNAGLDLLRAAAIAMVVVFHTIQMSPVSLPRLLAFAQVGQYGVDLFFVLSGWLIGGLYWREESRFGNVALVRFWMRRWLRTIPPYLVALAASWAAVWVVRSEPFDWGYLVFIQNYYSRIPFFLVSWSLCIEEHFYLFLPLILASPLGGKARPYLSLVALVLVPPVARWWVSHQGIDQGFGFPLTATHLRMEGLLIGFGLARLEVTKAPAWRAMRRMAPLVLSGAVIVFTVLQVWNSLWMYRIGLSALAIGFAGWLILMVGGRPGRVASSPLVKWVALVSYSVYLTHPLALHFSRRLVELAPEAFWPAYFPVAFAIVFGSGATFYLIVERTTIQLRDRWVPRRAMVR